MMKQHKPSIIVLIEPCISGVTADVVREKLSMKKWI